MKQILLSEKGKCIPIFSRPSARFVLLKSELRRGLNQKVNHMALLDKELESSFNFLKGIPANKEIRHFSVAIERKLQKVLELTE